MQPAHAEQMNIINQCYPPVCAAILVTGGYPDPAGGDSAVSAEVLRADGTAWCALPPLPYPTIVHSQSGEGGLDASLDDLF